MLKRFALHDENLGGRRVGTLTYDTARKAFAMDVDPGVPIADLPLSLEILVHRGDYAIGHDWAMRWVRARICPPGRHNIREILAELGLDAYDEFGILAATEARCDKDGLYIAALAGENSD